MFSLTFSRRKPCGCRWLIKTCEDCEQKICDIRDRCAYAESDEPIENGCTFDWRSKGEETYIPGPCRKEDCEQVSARLAEKKEADRLAKEQLALVEKEKEERLAKEMSALREREEGFPSTV
jgi:hypothetical protein